MTEYEFCRNLITQAGEKLQEEQKKAFSVSYKAGDIKNIVTSVDISVNNFIVSEIKKVYPDHSIHSEEIDLVEGNNYQWAVDPIDGSAAFARGIPQYAISIGLLKDGVPIVGAVLDPSTGELFSFEKRKGVFLNNGPVSASAEQELKSCFILFAAGRKDDDRDWAGESYKKLLGSVNKTKNFSSSALSLAYVAAGRIEGVVAGTFSTRDIAAAIGMVREQGGVVLTADGKDAAFSVKPQRIFVANTPELASSLISLLES